MPESTETPASAPQAVRMRLVSSPVCGPLAISLCVLLAITLTLDPADCRPELPAGPGITLDETFNVQMGVFLIDLVPQEYGWGILNPFNLMHAFEAPYNPDHPPLGRLWLGVFHRLVQTVAPPDGLDDAQFVTVSARFGSAAAFALTVLAVGAFTGRRFGPAAGCFASLSLVLMPRLFGHAHLAALETITNFVWTLTLLAAASLWTRGDHPSDRAAVVTGILLGAALLTKMQAILLPPLIGVWALWHWQRRAIRGLAITLSVGCAVFVLGWPWLWLDFPGHLVEYFSRTTQRGTLHVWYLGELLTDRDVPWHYAIVMFALTVPTLILAAGGLGALLAVRGGCPAEADSGESADRHASILSNPEVTLMLGSVAAPLVLFSLPGVTVYDGVRLFLVAFPGWAVLAGIGFARVWGWLLTRSRPVAIALACLFVGQGSASLLLYQPHWLSFYAMHIGGLRGAESIGMESTYWSDSFSREFLTEVTRIAPEGSTLEITPVMHPSQWVELYRQSPLLQRHGIRVQAFSDPATPTGEFLAVFHRKADAPTKETLESLGWTQIREFRTRGVTLASLWQQTR